ncbi:mechanosensitive ion channel [Pseudodesulfovibrio cashew]|uniref:Mechanosensitive ion channel n=1 Tax=Pseudodesulfovibrio cashew TaxID=2678688 RepID=A0A6I6J8Y1_9BACT|nr:mechanosensitive ion channel family protein [Pseudodesulfovibrio cashew]QGY39296.1 mechanosensitive ion channel [Pseudodesulfovibrio cashew]
MFRRASFVLLILLLLSLPAGAANLFPLEPPDTSSPRATLNSFLTYTDKLYEAATASREDVFLEREYLQRAERCFDLEQVPPTLRSEVAVESVLMLREILDRIELPETADVPDKNQVRENKLLRWRIPHTEITIERIAAGPRMGSYLFTAATVDQLEGFYNEVKDLPYRIDKGPDYTGFYEQYIYSSGWMIPDGFLKRLPDWMMEGVHGQAIWQWLALFVVMAVCGFSIWLVWKWSRIRPDQAKPGKLHTKRMLFPLYAMGMCTFIKFIANDQINITGDILRYLTVVLGAAFAVFAGIAIIYAGNIVMRMIISSAKIKEEALDADVIKLLCRLVTFCLIFILFYHVGSHFGIPVTAIFASAGIAGVAVALAARETLANFFGGVSIFMDRPFRAGDYIVLDSGERGEVMAVGMRSTRLLTRGDIMISIPNSVITNAKVVNQSMPHPSFRVGVKIGVAYGSDIDLVEATLLEMARQNALVIADPEPRVRFRAFGDSALEFELLCWAARPHDRGRLVHLLCKDIYRAFNEKGIIIPFPQQEIHIHRTED